MGIRPYQDNCFNAVEAELNQKVYRQLVVMATGTGKTVVFANLRNRLKTLKREMVLVHRDELVEQAKEKISHWNPNVRIGIEKADSYANDNDDYVIASVQTLGRANSKRIERFKPDEFSNIITDEAHHSVGDSYVRIFDHFGCGQEGKPWLLGVTATTKRGDKQALANQYDKIVFQYTIRDGIRDGYLADIRGFQLETKTNIDDVRTTAGDFNQADLSKSVNTWSRNTLIVKGWQEAANYRQTVVFCVDIAHAQEMAAEFKKYGIAAEAVWGVDPQRKNKIKAFREKHINVLCNCQVLTEGFDEWRIACIIMARPTKSELLFVQMCGRGTRIPEGIDNLYEARRLGQRIEKEDCLLIDVVDNTERHSLMTLPSIFGINPKMNLRGRSVLAVEQELNEAAAAHPNVDVTKITDINELQTALRKVNLWEVKWDAQVLSFSELQWHRNPDGSFVLFMPGGEKLSVAQDLLGKWNVNGTILGNVVFQPNFESLQNAFACAEDSLALHGKHFINMLRREAQWDNDPPSNAQLNMIRRFRLVPEQDIKLLTKRKASNILGIHFQRMKTWKK